MVRLARPGRRSHRYSVTALHCSSQTGRAGVAQAGVAQNVQESQSVNKQKLLVKSPHGHGFCACSFYDTPGKLFYNLGVKRAVVTFKNTWSRLSSFWIWIIFLWNRFCCGFKQTLQVTYIKCMDVYSEVKRLKNLKTVFTDSKFYFDFAILKSK